MYNAIYFCIIIQKQKIIKTTILQAEACEAGLEPRAVQEWLNEIDDSEEDPLTEILHKEIQKWTHNCVDVDVLQSRVLRAEEANRILSKKVTALQSQLQKLQLDKINSYNLQDNDNDKTVELMAKCQEQRAMSNGEDEGISSSERSSSPENNSNPKQSSKLNGTTNDNDQETTIDDVIEELRIIVKDAEEQFEDNKSGNPGVIKQRGDLADDKSFRTYSDKMYSYNLTTADETEQTTKITKKDSPGYYENELSDSSATRKLSRNSSTKVSKSSNEGSLKIVVKGPEDEEAIIPAIIHPQPPRRAPPCLSIFAPRTFGEHELPDDEEETVGDGSDSLLSASRLKYAGVVKNNGNGDDKVMMNNEEPLNDFDKRKDNKATTMIDNGVRKSSDSGKMEINKHSNSRYNKSELDKRKLLRRAASHDMVVATSNNSSPGSRRSGSKIEGKIRKFESLNCFDDQRSLQNFNVNHSKSQHDVSTRTTKMRRSESFHQISTAGDRGSSRGTRGGGSDSGLFYITDYDLEPTPATVVSKRSSSPTLMTKSLDRIDEGLDSMVNIVITDKRYSSSNHNKIHRAPPPPQPPPPMNDYRYHRQLKNDELYEDKRIKHCDYKNMINQHSKRYSDSFDYSPMITSRTDPYGFDRKYSTNRHDPGIFLPGRAYDAFGLVKNRFNAGKYSGEMPIKEAVNVNARSANSYNVAKRGKVTDFISGLY